MQLVLFLSLLLAVVVRSLPMLDVDGVSLPLGEGDDLGVEGVPDEAQGKAEEETIGVEEDGDVIVVGEEDAIGRVEEEENVDVEGSGESGEESRPHLAIPPPPTLLPDSDSDPSTASTASPPDPTTTTDTGATANLTIPAKDPPGSVETKETINATVVEIQPPPSPPPPPPQPQPLPKPKLSFSLQEFAIYGRQPCDSFISVSESLSNLTRCSWERLEGQRLLFPDYASRATLCIARLPSAPSCRSLCEAVEGCLGLHFCPGCHRHTCRLLRRSHLPSLDGAQTPLSLGPANLPPIDYHYWTQC